MAHDTVITIRLSSEMVEEAEELVPKLAADPRYRSLPRLSRASVLRLALDMGLHSLRVHLATAPMLEPDAVGPTFDMGEGGD